MVHRVSKVHLISKLGGEGSSDSLSLKDMKIKLPQKQLQVNGFLKSVSWRELKKAGLTRLKPSSPAVDKYRASFGRRLPHIRAVHLFVPPTHRTVIFVILREPPVLDFKTPGIGRMKPWELSNEDVEQIWAEVLCLLIKVKKLYLDTNLESYSQVEQSAAMEKADPAGSCQSISRSVLPENWPE
jgi:hypothetical protein